MKTCIIIRLRILDLQKGGFLEVNFQAGHQGVRLAEDLHRLSDLQGKISHQVRRQILFLLFLPLRLRHLQEEG